MHLGFPLLEQSIVFYANTHDFTTSGAPATDSASPPTYRVYENETTSPILDSSMALLDSGNTAGYYSETLALTVASGFELGKSYSIYMSATTGGVVNTGHHQFQIKSFGDAGLAYYGLVSSIAGGTKAPTISTPRSDANGDYDGMAVLFRDVTNLPNAAGAEIVTSTSGGVINLVAAPNFTVAVGDKVEIFPSLLLPTVAEIAAGMLDLTDGVETGLTVREWFRLGGAALFGKSSGQDNDNPKYRDRADTKNRITSVTSSDGRSSVSTDAS